jgi:hypothetical protein
MDYSPGTDWYSLGKAQYEIYCDQARESAIATGYKLPDFEDLKPEDQQDLIQIARTRRV